MIESINGIRATLGNREVVKLNYLQKVFDPKGEGWDVNEVQKVGKKFKRAIKREGIDVDNMLDARLRSWFILMFYHIS